MTRFEIEMLALAMYESHCRYQKASVLDFIGRSWEDLGPSTRNSWRQAARKQMAEEISA